MITVYVWDSEKDGAHLAVSEQPMWAVFILWLLDLVSYPASRWGWFYLPWSRLIISLERLEKRRYQVKLTDHPCLVAERIWGPDKNHLCWYDKCPVRPQ